MQRSVYIVIPTIRNLQFLDEWKNQFKQCHLIIVEDHATREIDAPKNGFLSVSHFDWTSIREDFGSNEWIFSRQNAGIRSYGFWKAYSLGAEYIITLDDDCYPVEKNFVAQHLRNLVSRSPDRWFTTFPHPDFMYTRGFPYEVRESSRVVISHGLWSNKMDMDAQTQIQIGDVNTPPYPPLRQFVPHGMYFPMSSMNLAFAREVVPLMFFPLMGKDQIGNSWGFDRFDDIWSGIIAKKIIDHLGLSVVNGSPFVEHRKASDTQSNLVKERTGVVVNEWFWKSVDSVILNSQTPAACMRELSEKIQLPNERYFTMVRKAIRVWSDLF